MPTLMTPSQFQDYTNTETATGEPALERRIAKAQGRLEDYLGRRLAYGFYTETLEISRRGYVYPAAVPVAEVSASSGVEIVADDTLRVPATVEDFVVEPYRRHYERYATVSYWGGWTWDTCPTMIKDALCVLTAQAAQFNPTDRRAFATQIRVGDVALGFDYRAVKGSLNAAQPGMGDDLKGYRLGRL